MATGQYRLGIDFGTSNTTAILRWPDGHARPLLFDGTPLLPSAVYADADGRLLVGRDAIHAARLDPARFEPTPKRRVADGEKTTVHLGDQDVSATMMVSAVLERVRDEAVRVSGAKASDLDVTLTHPAAWGPAQTQTLVNACRKAGLPDPRLVPEPVAAAGYFVSVLGRSIPPASALVVYDFGGGTFDASVVTAMGSGYEVLAVDGLTDVGGVDLDSLLLEHLAAAHRTTDPEAWQRLENPQTAADRRHRRHLVEDVRAAKEMLSRAPNAAVPLPLLETEARVTREEFEALARPVLERTVRTTIGVIAAANLQPGGVAAVLLVGGSSRIPMVANLLREGTELEPATIEQPETVVAEGSVRLASGGTGETRAGSAIPATPPVAGPTPTVATPAATTVVVAPPPTPVIASPPPPVVAPTRVAPAVPVQAGPPTMSPPHRGTVVQPRKRRRGLAVFLSLVSVLAIAAGAYFVAPLVMNTPGTTNPSTTTQGPVKYTRTNPPAWLPTSYTLLIDDGLKNSMLAGQATNGGTCTYLDTGVIDIQRDDAGVSGCKAVQLLKTTTVADAAVEARFRVSKGCGGLWMRTGSVGYFLAVCADASVRLHRLGDTDPDDANRLGRWTPGFDPRDVVVGLLAEGNTLTVYINGVAQQPGVTEGSIPSGHVAVGGFAPNGNGIDATVSQYRAWWRP